MKKALLALLPLIALGLWWRSHHSGSDSNSDPHLIEGEISASQKRTSQPEVPGNSSSGQPEAASAQLAKETAPRLPEGADSQKAASQVSAALQSTKEPAASQTNTTRSSSSSQEPAIGTVRVLGYRGCDLNTQGWFLSKGRPDQYDFKVSDDGNSLVVEPIAHPLDGQFEFIHCVGASGVVGKQVRFTAKIKTEDVVQTAQIRLRGENLDRQNVSGDLTKVGGTHDWQDFSVETYVKPEVVNFSYGLTFRSSGKLWISSPKFEILP